jgi:hypothetical protein
VNRISIAMGISIFGFVMIWAAIDTPTTGFAMVIGIVGGVLFGGGVILGLFGQ